MGYRMSDPRTGLAGSHSSSTIPQPSSTIVIGDSTEMSYSGNGLYIIGYSTVTYMPTCHRAGGNFGFADGHVTWYSASTIYRNTLWNVNK